MKESDAQKAILDYLTLRKHFCWRNNSGALKTERGQFIRFGAKGSPDIICVIDGAFWGLEVKNDKGTLSESQEQFRDDVRANRGHYEVVRSIDDVQALGL